MNCFTLKLHNLIIVSSSSTIKSYSCLLSHTSIYLVFDKLSTCCLSYHTDTYHTSKHFAILIKESFTFIIILLKGGYPFIFASNVFLNSHLIQKCIQNQQLFLILYTFLNQMRVGKNIRRKNDRIISL